MVPALLELIVLWRSWKRRQPQKSDECYPVEIRDAMERHIEQGTQC